MRSIFKIFIFTCIVFGLSLNAKVLTPDEAFDVGIVKKAKAFEVSIKLGDKIYLYDDKLKFDIVKPVNISLDKELKRPTPKKYKKHMILNQDMKISIPLELVKKYVPSGEFNLQVSWQGCSEQGLCYQPMKKEFTFDMGGGLFDGDLSEQDAIAKALKSGNILWVLLSFFGFGVLLSLTPCVFPMIPILSSIIVSNSGEKMTGKRGFWLSLVYVLAMAVAYTIAGVLAGLFGANIQTALQMPSVIITFSLIFVALSFSMFGFYELELPKSWQRAATQKSEGMKGHGVWGVAVMGFLSALIVGPCVAAPLAGALIYIGQSGDALIGGAALFIMSIGMGVPLLIIGASAGKLLPRPGIWMDNIKSIFGVMMLGVAIWMMSRILSGQITMILWAFLLIGSAVYMGVFQPIKEGVSGWFKLLKTFALIVLVYGIMLFVGAMSGGTNPLDPLKGLKGEAVASQSIKSKFVKVKNVAELEEIVQNSTKPVMLDFYADWCVSCIELEEYTFSDPKVAKVLDGFTLLQADVTNNTEEDKELLKKFGLFGPPGIIFYKERQELKNLQLVGFKNAEDFLKHLEKVK